jgi:hypothetical protein
MHNLIKEKLRKSPCGEMSTLTKLIRIISQISKAEIDSWVSLSLSFFTKGLSGINY